jgi:hypothetical protein
MKHNYITLSLYLFIMYYYNSVLIMKYRGRSIAVLQNECYRLEVSYLVTISVAAVCRTCSL